MGDSLDRIVSTALAYRAREVDADGIYEGFQGQIEAQDASSVPC